MSPSRLEGLYEEPRIERRLELSRERVRSGWRWVEKLGLQRGGSRKERRVSWETRTGPIKIEWKVQDGPFREKGFGLKIVCGPM